MALHDRLRCPIDVLVICVDDALARSIASPLGLGRGPSVFRPLVVGPDAVPLVVDPAQAARNPELAVLSALAHRENEDAAFTALAAAAGLDRQWWGLHADIIWSALKEVTRRAVKARMAQSKHPRLSTFARTHPARNEMAGWVKCEAKGRAEGEAHGAAKALLAVLEARRLRVTAEQREQVLGCTDLALLEGWVREALTVKTTAELLARPNRPAKARR